MPVPPVLLSFVLAGVASIFAALCYSEFASLVPMAGSAYTYGYATLGEIFAWIIGWDLILEYAVGAITVAVGWSGYVVSFLHDFGIDIPAAFSQARGTELIQIPAALAGALKAKAGWLALSAGLSDQIRALGTDPTTCRTSPPFLTCPRLSLFLSSQSCWWSGLKSQQISTM